MLGDEAFDSVPTEPFCAIANEQRCGRVAFPLRKPDAERFHTIFSEWSGSLLSPLAHAANMRARGKNHVATV